MKKEKQQQCSRCKRKLKNPFLYNEIIYGRTCLEKIKKIIYEQIKIEFKEDVK